MIHVTNDLHGNVVVFVVSVCHPDENTRIDNCDCHQLVSDSAGSSS
ncbi:hypothetical protein HTIA_0611 [Halorhabdus tiamatea SARL4B]|uniref:Uncharacterized protein n=1 Tax=Halorhabdus tiamatea SARL4B TaxID=1033806 RepID=S6D1X4_9EURY|nr:hypothetical protein HTIA_0611 [Halorhabdus tiamatea SARL4B]